MKETTCKQGVDIWFLRLKFHRQEKNFKVAEYCPGLNKKGNSETSQGMYEPQRRQARKDKSCAILLGEEPDQIPMEKK